MPQIFLSSFVSKREKILAFGGESEGVFSFFERGEVFVSENFGDLLQQDNFQKFKKSVLRYLQKNKIKPRIILTDLHPLYKTTIWGKELAKKLRAEHIQVQHHIAHIFSVLGEKMINYKLHNVFGIACDGTGYGFDGKIWGGEIFEVSKVKSQLSVVRIGHLENQILIGGDLAIKEPARMIISILSKFLDKNGIYKFVKKYYSKNQFEVLFNQLRENFNCQETSSTARVLDAVSLFLGFAKNERKLKHQASILLEKNSSFPYFIKPRIKETFPFEISTTDIFKYLLKNLKKDKKKLAATTQIYLAKGFFEICQRVGKNLPIYFGGGLAKNKILSQYLKEKGVKLAEILPPGDQSLSFGQIIYFLLADSGNQFSFGH